MARPRWPAGSLPGQARDTRSSIWRTAGQAALSEPKLALAHHRGLVVLDEVQRQPDLFPVPRVLAGRPNRPANFVILGSASPDLRRQSSESLAGRIHQIEMGGFDASEIGFAWRDIDRLWLRGGMPRFPRRFWMMVAHYHGQTWNASEIAGSLGVAYKRPSTTSTS